MDDCIEKRITLHAPMARVFQALTDSREFGAWFGVTLSGPFVQGASLRAEFGALSEERIMAAQRSLGLEPGKIVQPDPRATFCTVERIEPVRYFSFRWIPYGIDAEADLEHEPTTLVEFVLVEVPGGTELTVRESGFARVPAHRRARAFRMNEAGWAAQLDNVKRHVEAH